MSWGEQIARSGPASYYRPGYFADYPPAFLYVLWSLAALFDGETLRLVVKSVSIPFDAALSIAFAAIVWRGSAARGVLAAALWSLAPGAVIAGAYWGQVDAVGTAVALATLWAASRKQWALAGALGGLAAVLKFQFGLALFVVGIAALIESYRARTWRPLLAAPAAIIVVLLIGLPFGQGPLQLWELLRNAGEEYPFTSLYAFNIWAVSPGFWKTDDPYVVLGGIFLGAGLIASVVPLWWRRDLAALLAAGAIASLAFYFLPTRAHERYLFPAVALLVPFAAARWRVLLPWLVLSAGYALTLVFALVRTVYTDVTVPAWLDRGLFSRPGQVAIAVAMILAALSCAVLVTFFDRSFAPHPLGLRPRVRSVARALVVFMSERREGIASRIAYERAHERRVQRAALAAILALPMLLNAVALLPEITIGIPSNNDDANHYAYIVRADDALSRGENVLEFWMPSMELGFPPFLYYQHLPHLVVVALARVTFGLVDLLTLFNIVRYVLLVTLPLTVWWSLRTLGMPAAGAAFAGAAASLVAGAGRFGIEYDSFVWRGWGMYTQLWAVHLTFLSLAFVHRLLETGRGLVRTVVVLAALALSHLIWAYMTVFSVLVLFLVGLRRATWRARAIRLAAAGSGALVVSSYMWLPFLLEKRYLNVSQPYLPEWRFDSFGFGQIVSWLVTGDLLDHARLPVLTLALAGGLVAVALRRDRLAALAAALFALWLVLWSGRTSLGALADLLPLGEGMHVHRFVGGVDVAAVLLIGLGAALVWRVVGAEADARRAVAAGVLFVVLLAPAMWERAGYYGLNTQWMTETRDATLARGDTEALVATIASLPPARVYAGLNNAWLQSLDLVPFNSVRIPDLLNAEGITRVAKPYASLSLDADVLFSFDPNVRAQWDVLDARYAVAREGQPVPSFLVPIRSVGRYVLYAAPTSGWTAFAATTRLAAAAKDEQLFFQLRDWLVSDGPARRAYVRYAYPSSGVADAAVRSWCTDGKVSFERMQPDRFDALLACDGASTVVLKWTFHPNWHVTVDDRPVETFMVSPGFIGFEMPPGSHYVTAQYTSTPLKTPLAALGALSLAALVAYRRRIARLLSDSRRV